MDEPPPLKPKKATWRMGARERTHIQWVVVAAICLLLFVMLRPTFVHMAEVRDFQTCQTHMRKIALAVKTYAADYDDTLPLSSNWTEAVLGSMTPTSGTGFKLADELHCPRDKSGGKSSYAYNSLLSGISPGVKSDSPAAESRRASIQRFDRVPLIFEHHGSPMNASNLVTGYDSFKGMLTRPHELPARTGSFISGAAQASSMTEDQLNELAGRSFLKPQPNSAPKPP
jgi:hypothetical protein